MIAANELPLRVRASRRDPTLGARGLAVSDDLRACVEAISDLVVLDAWLLAAATATRADDAIR